MDDKSKPNEKVPEESSEEIKEEKIEDEALEPQTEAKETPKEKIKEKLKPSKSDKESQEDSKNIITETKKEESPEKRKISVRCPQCKTVFTIEKGEKPTNIECPKCGKTGKSD